MSAFLYRHAIPSYRVLLGATLLLAAFSIAFQVFGSGTLWAAPGFFPQITLILALGAFLFPVPGVAASAGIANRAVPWQLLGAAAMLLPIAPLLITWAGLHPYYSSIGGVVPWSDAGGYYVGAEHLLHVGELDAWSQRRPVNAILLALRLALTGEDFRGAMVIQAGLFGVSALAASWAVARSCGIRAGIAMYALLFAFAALYLPTTLSEALGVTLGSVALVALWIAVERKSLFIYCLGLFFLSFALSARPGAMLVLASLTVAAGRLFRQDRRFNGAAFGGAVSVVVLAFAYNRILWQLYGDGTGASFSNFSTVLYGLVVGGKGWTQVYADYPLLGTLSESAASEFIYRQAWERFTDMPWVAAKAVLVGMVVEPIQYLVQMARLIFLGSDGDLRVPLVLVAPIATSFVLAVGAGLARWMKEARRSELAAFLGYFWIGIWLSLPFFYMDGGIRSVAATHPIAAVTIVLALSGSKVERTNVGWRGVTGLLAAVAVILALVVVLVPAVMPIFPVQQKITPVWRCPEGVQAVQVQIGRGIPRIAMRPFSSQGLPCTGLCKFPAVPPTNEGRNLFSRLRYPQDLILAYDAVSDGWLYVTAPSLDVGDSDLEIKGCGKAMRDGKQVLWGLESLAGHR